MACLQSPRARVLPGPPAPHAGGHPTPSLCCRHPHCTLRSPLQIDLQFMSELAGEVPVVPVLAKADTMTSEELKVRGWRVGVLKVLF